MEIFKPFLTSFFNITSGYTVEMKMWRRWLRILVRPIKLQADCVQALVMLAEAWDEVKVITMVTNHTPSRGAHLDPWGGVSLVQDMLIMGHTLQIEAEDQWEFGLAEAEARVQVKVR